MTASSSPVVAKGLIKNRAPQGTAARLTAQNQALANTRQWPYHLQIYY